MRAMHLPLDPADRGPAWRRSRVSIGPSKHSGDHREGVRESFRVDLRNWVVAEHEAGSTRFTQAVSPHVPQERWRDRAGEGGASIAWLLFHLSYHQDLATATVLQARPPLLAERRQLLGLGDRAPHDGLGEAEQPDVTAALELPAVADYARDV